jgi:hypothetical protein
VKPLPPARLVVATVALFAAAFYAPLSVPAQLPQLIPQAAVENAELLLPDAPVSQTSDQAPLPATGQAPAPVTPAAPSSSSQQGAPASGSAAPPDPAAAAADAKKKQHDEAEQELKAEEKQRLLGVMPQFQVVMNGQAAPMSGGQKWRLALHSAIDPFYIGWAFTIGGGWSEIVDSNRGYGWGDGGYFKRVGANYADNVNGALVGNALLPQLLRQDPRYFRKGTGPIFKRFLYAAESTVVCRGDNGKNQANVSNVLGNFVSGAISNTYYPKEERGALLTVENGISVTLFGALGGQILEFGPDLQRLVNRKKKAAAPAAPATGPAPSTPGPAPASTTPGGVPPASD